MRAFVALTPSAEASGHLEEFLAVRRHAADFRWSDDFHLTLAFFEQLPEHASDDLTDRLAEICARHRPWTARIAGGGAFPHPDRAKVLWAGLRADDPDRLERLSSSCRHAGSAVGANVDGRRFTPHLTIARMVRPRQVSSWVRLLDAYAGPEFEVGSVSLFASHLGEGRGRRPRYEELARLSF